MDDKIQDVLDILSLYRTVISRPITSNSNLNVLPPTNTGSLSNEGERKSVLGNLRMKDKGGYGPRTRLLLYGDETGISCHKSMTDSIEVVRLLSYVNMDAFEIVTSHHLKNTGVTPNNSVLSIEQRRTSHVKEPEFNEKQLTFLSYHTLLAVLHDLVIVNEIPTEWAAIWILKNKQKIHIYDCYVSFANNKFPLRPITSSAVMIALEGQMIGAYPFNYTPKLLDTKGNEVDRSKKKSSKDSPNNEIAVDILPIPLLVIRKSSKLSDDGQPRYYACSGEEDCHNIIESAHFRMKKNTELHTKLLDASNIIRLVMKLLKTHIFLPIPYFRITEIDRCNELFDPDRYKRIGNCCVFSP